MLTMEKIPHIHNINFPQLKRMFENPSTWSATQKIDGFNVSFGLINNEPFVKPKSGKIYTDLKELKLLAKELVYFKPFVSLLDSLQNSRFSQMCRSKPEGLTYFGEILTHARQNIISYDKNIIGDGIVVVFGTKIDLGNGKSNDITLSDNNHISSLTGMPDYDIKMNFIQSKKINLKDIHFSQIVIDIQNFIKNNETILTTKSRDPKIQLEKIIKNGKLNNLIKTFKTNMIEITNNEIPLLGADIIEGMVIRNKTNNQMMKIVDTDLFSAKNKTAWTDRLELNKLSKNLIINIKKDILNNSDLTNKYKINDEINFYLSGNAKKKFNNIEEIHKLLEDSFLKENKPKSNKMIFAELSSYVAQLRSLYDNLNKKQKSENKIDDDNYNRTVSNIRYILNNLTNLLKFNKAYINGKLIWFCLEEKFKSELINKYMEN